MVGLFALTCGALALAWMRGRLVLAAIVLFVLAAARLGPRVRRSRDGDSRCRRVRDLRHQLHVGALRVGGRVPGAASAHRTCSLRDAGRPRATLAGAEAPGPGEAHVAMASEFKLPDLGEGLTEGEVARWLVTEGQEIAEDDPLVEIQTDKATVEVPSPYAGTVLRIVVAEGDVAPVGAVLVVIGEPGEASCRRSQSRRTGRRSARRMRATQRVQATPVVRRIAAELSVDVPAMAGTGPGGRITEEDVRSSAAATERRGRREPLRGVRRDHRRAHDACSPRGPAGHLGRGVRLRGRAAGAASRNRGQGVPCGACRSSPS